jgi:hypothetical protein
LGRVFLIIGALGGWLVLAVAVLFILVGISDAQVGNRDSSTEFTIAAVLAAIGLGALVPCLIFTVRKPQADPYAALAAGAYAMPWQGGMPAPSSSGQMPVAGRIALILGAIAGGLTVAFGLLGLALGLTDTTSTPSDRSSTILGSWMIIEIGIVVFAPCMFVLLRLQARNPLSVVASGIGYPGYPSGATAIAPPGYGTNPVAPSEDLARSYVEWYGWCTQSVRGGAIAMHAATIAAMQESAAGNSSRSSEAAREAAARVAGAVSGQPDGQAPAKLPKIRILSRIAAATLPMLEPGEQVMVSLFGIDRQSTMWGAAFGLLGYLIAASQFGAYFITVTDRRLIVLKGRQLTLKPSAVDFVAPRSMVAQASYKKGLFGQGVFQVTRSAGGRTTIQTTRLWAGEAAFAGRVLAAPSTVPQLPPSPTMSLPY